MIAALLARFTGAAALRLGKPLLLAFALLFLLLLAGLAFQQGVSGIERMVGEARAEASKARDAHWLGLIEKSNAEAEKARADFAEALLQNTAAAETEISALRQNLDMLEKKNAALPNGAGCGLDANRARLLNAR